MKWYHYLICTILIIAGIFSTINLIDLFNKKSAEYGTAIRIVQEENYTEISKFDDTRLSDFISEDYVNFTSIATFEPVEFNGENKNYLITLNGQPANNVVTSNGRISGVVTLTFYGLEGEKSSVATLNIVIEYSAKQTKVTITTKNENDSVAYLSTYSDISGFVLRVVERR